MTQMELIKYRTSLNRMHVELAIGGDAKLLQDVESALGRIAVGTFGICLGCEYDISHKRLSVMPWAASCIVCQEEAGNRDGEASPAAEEHVLGTAWVAASAMLDLTQPDLCPPSPSTDRRSRVRFPLDLAFSCRTLERRVRYGAGRTVNISSAGILVESPDTFAPGTSVELTAEWPVRLQGWIPLQLVVTGSVVRCELCRFAMTADRIRLIPGHPDDAPQTDLPSNPSKRHGTSSWPPALPFERHRCRDRVTDGRPGPPHLACIHDESQSISSYPATNTPIGNNQWRDQEFGNALNPGAIQFTVETGLAMFWKEHESGWGYSGWHNQR
jgi:hypothetical protein